ncbi:MAG: 3-methyl-2-oxobutanoate hydroxymethyltransferase [Magnetococcus sp. WYHC-3]
MPAIESAVTMDPTPVTMPALRVFKQTGRPIVAVTAYDYTLATIAEAAGVDILLVGDSLGMVVQGHETPLPVTLEQMIYHTAAVRRAARHALVVLDLPFGSYQTSPQRAFDAAARALAESGADAVKLEGGCVMADTIAFLVQRGIPVLGHVGMTPQSVRRFGGFRVQGRGEAAALAVQEDARAVAQAGADAVVLECVPQSLAARISAELPIPTIGIGAGAACDGQVLVLHDLLGLYPGVQPRFVKRYVHGAAVLGAGVGEFAREVRERRFPAPEHAFGD